MKKALPFIIGLLSLIGHAQAPANDDCSSAQVIIPNSPSISGTFTNATNSTAINCTSSVSYADVWYEFTAIAELAYIQLSNITPSAVLRISLFSNDCLINTAPLQCGTYPTNLIIGQVYKVRLYTTSSAPENLNANFNISIAAPTTPILPITASTSQYTPEELITDVFFNSDCVTISNINTVTGTNFGTVNGIAYFDNNGSDFGLETGIILSNGNALNTPGPNYPDLSSGSSGWLGDSDLESVFPDTNTHGASILEFDFTSTSNHFSFDFIFASNEYGTPNWECGFTDLIAFILTDITDPTLPPRNLAVLPGIMPLTPVNTTTVHPDNGAPCGAANPEFFNQYYMGASALEAPVNFNGVTIPIQAYADIDPTHAYHLKLVIANEGDNAVDSAVFIAPANFSACQPPAVQQPEDLVYCNFSSEGFASFDLTEVNNSLLGDLNPLEYTITYHSTEADAIAGTSSLPSNYLNSTAWNQEVYARVTNSENPILYSVAAFNLIVSPVAQFQFITGTICIDYQTNEITPYVLDTGLDPANHTFEWSLNATIIEGADQSAYSASEPGLYSVNAISNLGCYSYASSYVASSGLASPIDQGYTIEGQTVTINVEGYGNYIYALDNNGAQESNIFNDVAPGTHTVNVIDQSGCGSLVLSFEIEVPVVPPAPDGMEDQDFTEGETLADLEIQGENIQWYDGLSSDSTMNTQETPLPLTTLLVDGTTYYASQTINGTESEERLAVTVHLTMGVDEKSFNGLKYHPNPAVNTLYISNNGILDTITIYNLVGQTVLSKNIDSEKAELDLSALNRGMYIVKIDSDGQSKTIKIQKI